MGCIDSKPSYPEYGKSFKELSEEQGFEYSEHEAVTKDGFKLKVLRLKKKDLPADSPVAFCQHGLTSQADTWIHQDPKTAIGFRLAREGYDVFFGNNRGNTYSTEHTSLNANDNAEKYYDYSFETLGEHDVPT